MHCALGAEQKQEAKQKMRPQRECGGPSGAGSFTWLHLKRNSEVSSPCVNMFAYHPSSEVVCKGIFLGIWWWIRASDSDFLEFATSVSQWIHEWNYLCVPACALHVQPVYVSPFSRRYTEVLAILLGDVTQQTHAVQGPLIPVIHTQRDLVCQAPSITFQPRHPQAERPYLRAIACMMAVRKDCGLKKPASHTAEGKTKSADQASSSLILASRSMNHRVRPDMEG